MAQIEIDYAEIGFSYHLCFRYPNGRVGVGPPVNSYETAKAWKKVLLRDKSKFGIEVWIELIEKGGVDSVRDYYNKKNK